MADFITVNVNADPAYRLLRRLRRKSIRFAAKAAMDEGAKLLREALIRQWRVDMEPLRRSFPGTVLKARRSFVGQGKFKPARVLSIAANELLKDQIKGGTRTPTRGRALLVRATKRKPRTRVRTYTAGGFVWQARKRGGNKYLGVLKGSTKIPRRYRVRKAVKRIERVFPRIVRKHLRRELRKARLGG